MNRFSLLCSLFAASMMAQFAIAQPQPVAFDWFEYSGTNGLVAKVGPGEYQNPILAGFYPDPSICRAGDDFFLVNSTFANFPGIPIFHSRDLVNWKQIGHVIHQPDQLRYDRVGVSGGIYALLTTDVAGGFVGATVGPYARIDRSGNS